MKTPGPPSGLGNIAFFVYSERLRDGWRSAQCASPQKQSGAVVETPLEAAGSAGVQGILRFAQNDKT